METRSNNCPPTYLALGIIGTLLGCFPFGILAILKSVEVTTLYRDGNIFESRIASSRAKAFGVLSIVLAILVILAIIALTVFIICESPDWDVCELEESIENLFDV